jgi:hypothetical protein
MTQPDVVCPRLTSVKELRIFLADDTLSKRNDVFTSLGVVGVSSEAVVEVATSFNQAQAFIDRQRPGQLEANVFMIDGSLDICGGLHQGSELVGMLFGKYLNPIKEAVDVARQGLDEALADTLPSGQINKLLNNDAPLEIAVNALHLDALLLGISSDARGRLRLAQIPRVDSLDIAGEAALTALLGTKGFRRHMTHLEKMKNPNYAAAQAARQARSAQA